MTTSTARRLDLARTSNQGRNAVPRRSIAADAARRLGSDVPQDERELGTGILAKLPKSRLGQLGRILWLEPRAVIFIAVGTILASLLSLMQPQLTGQIVGKLQTGVFADVVPYGLALAGIAVVASGFTSLVGALSAVAGNRSVQRFRDEAAKMSLRIPAGKLVQHPTADLVARCSIDAELLNKVFSRGPLQALGNIVIVGGALIQMVIIDPMLTSAALGMTVACLVFIVILSRRLTGLSYQRQEAQGGFVAELTRSLESVLTLRAYVAEKFAARRLDVSSNELLVAANRGDRSRAFMGPIITACLQATLVLVVFIAVMRVHSGVLPIESLVAFFMFTLIMVGPILGSSDLVMEIAKSLGAVQRLVELEEVTRQAPSSRIHTKPVQLEAVTEPVQIDLRGYVDFENVSVKYPEASGGREYALDDVSFSVPAGAWVALTGSSGSGKSTILSLMEKFVEPTSGRIWVDGIPLDHLDEPHYRRQVGYIEQSCPLFSGTVRDNLLLGRDIDDEHCWEIIRQVGLGNVISDREGGLSAAVGESAYAFSGGERQRLAIARTLVGQPRMLLLDEITSGLDVLNRAQVMNVIRATMPDTTTLAAGHGNFGIDAADLVIVLDKGRLVEFGTPAEVRRRSALFRSLIAA